MLMSRAEDVVLLLNSIVNLLVIPIKEVCRVVTNLRFWNDSNKQIRMIRLKSLVWSFVRFQVITRNQIE